MPGLPKAIQVGAMRYTLAYDGTLTDCVGETKAEQQTIRIKPGQGPDYEADTVLHETIHTCFVHSPLELDHDFEEKVCLALAPVLLDVLRRNPKLVEYLTRG